MAGEVVHNYDVAWAEGREQNLSDIGLEPVAVDRAVEHHRRDHAIEPKARHERRRLAMAVRETNAQPLASGTAPVRARHVRRGPGLINEYEPRGIEIRLRFEPCLALLQDVGPILLNRMAGLFLRVSP